MLLLAVAMVAKGLLATGYDRINLDDEWSRMTPAAPYLRPQGSDAPLAFHLSLRCFDEGLKVKKSLRVGANTDRVKTHAQDRQEKDVTAVLRGQEKHSLCIIYIIHGSFTFLTPGLSTKQSAFPSQGHAVIPSTPHFTWLRRLDAGPDEIKPCHSLWLTGHDHRGGDAGLAAYVNKFTWLTLTVQYLAHRPSDSCSQEHFPTSF